MKRFADRSAAGRQLAAALAAYRHRGDVLILALPRGGVPVAAEVAAVLRAPLDLLLVRKLGVPGREELAMGAIAGAGPPVLNEQLVQALQIPAAAIEQVRAREQQELRRREQVYRGGRPMPPVANRCVIVIDDGIATGATMRAAVAALRALDPARIVIAVPVAPADTVAALRRAVDEVICLATPEPFHSVGDGYDNFSQVDDAVVKALAPITK